MRWLASRFLLASVLVASPIAVGAQEIADDLVEPAGPEGARFDFTGLDQWQIRCFQGGEEVLSLSPVYRIHGGGGSGLNNGGWQYVLPDGRRFVGRIGTNVTCSYNNLTNPIARESFETERELAGIARPVIPDDDVLEADDETYLPGLNLATGPTAVPLERSGIDIERLATEAEGTPAERLAEIQRIAALPEIPQDQRRGLDAVTQVPIPPYSPALRQARGLPDLHAVTGDLILTGELPVASPAHAQVNSPIAMRLADGLDALVNEGLAMAARAGAVPEAPSLANAAHGDPVSSESASLLPGPSDPGPSDPGPSDPGPSDPGPPRSWPLDRVEAEANLMAGEERDTLEAVLVATVTELSAPTVEGIAQPPTLAAAIAAPTLDVVWMTAVGRGVLAERDEAGNEISAGP